jgi:hypothetical protein
MADEELTLSDRERRVLGHVATVPNDRGKSRDTVEGLTRALTVDRHSAFCSGPDDSDAVQETLDRLEERELVSQRDGKYKRTAAGLKALTA